jgi:hypothetical protein
MNNAVGYEVTMVFRVICVDHGTLLLEDFQRTYVVRPPVWSVDDFALLRMHLEHLGEVQCLYDIRKNLHTDEQYHSLQHLRNYIVKGQIVSWATPVDEHGKRKKYSYTQTNGDSHVSMFGPELHAVEDVPVAA